MKYNLIHMNTYEYDKSDRKTCTHDISGHPRFGKQAQPSAPHAIAKAMAEELGAAVHGPVVWLMAWHI